MYYTIKQMAAMFDVTEHTLRYYTATIRDHALLMDFLSKRDAVGAEAAMRIHLRSAINVLALRKDS